MPFKANAARRHRIPRQRHRVTDWAEYDAALRQRGSLTVWFTDEAVAAWRAEPRTTRGGQPWYSPLAASARQVLGVQREVAAEPAVPVAEAVAAELPVDGRRWTGGTVVHGSTRLASRGRVG